MRLNSKITPDRLVAIAVSLLPLIYFLPATRGHLVISPDDGLIFNIPIRVAVANLLHAGHLPLWTPDIFCGMPLFGAAQAGVLFPLNWFYLAFSAPVATNLMMLSSYMVAALGAYLYARRSGSSVPGAALTSLVWQGSGFLIGQIGHTNILHTAALLPWVLWAIDGYGESGKRSHGLLLAALVAVQVFAGHQQTLVYALLFAAAYALVMWRGQAVSPQSTQSRTAYLRSLVFLAAGLVLAAVQVLPMVEMLRHSLRASASYDFFTSFSLPPHFLWTFFAPYVVGGGDGQLFRAPYLGPAYYGEYVGYVGLATIALAMVAVALKRDARTTFYGAVVLAGLLLALGRYAPFDFYKLIYAFPVLNLFRVPARHLMEVEFALAVLAGRGLTAIVSAGDRAKTLRWVTIAGAVVLGLTCLAVTFGRPVDFRLGRTGPVSLLRAPELFLPIILAAGSGWALYNLARGRRRAWVYFWAVIALDLSLWGQSTGWRVASPRLDSELWREPPTVQFLRERARSDKAAVPDRILTQDYFFDPTKTVVVPKPGGAGWVPSLQPDIYMMYGVENAAGYDGFGLARYSRLAGDMKIWGDLADAERTLRGESREVDLLNVRYLLARSSAVTSDPVPERLDFPAATEVYGGEPFAEESLNVKGILGGERLSFKVPTVEVDHIALLTSLAWSESVPDHEIIADIRLHAQDGRTFHFELRAGDHTSEWAHDRAEIQTRIKHSRAPVATSYEVKDGQVKFQAHTYLCAFGLPEKTAINGVEITRARVGVAPQLILSLNRLTLVDGERAFPLRAEWSKAESVTSAEEPLRPEQEVVSRWKPIGEVGKVAVFENMRMLPRAWLAVGELVASDEEQISIIRSGKTPAGLPWDPLEQALVEVRTGVDYAKGGGPPKDRAAEITLSRSSRIDVKTDSAAPSLLVLSENHYPGWRASVDGEPAEIKRVNYNQRGVAVPAGKHLVTFVYRPGSVLAGLAVSLVTLAGLSLWAAGVGARGGCPHSGKRVISSGPAKGI
jgi:hypothetical protein